jgi:hypothetical protein
MSGNPPFGFGKLVPGFDFLQNLAKGASQTMQMPNLSSWVAPTLNVEELDKRITELKAVQFWLDQNHKALAATIQALEVQKMTLATLRGMNFSMGELAEAMTLKPVDKGGAAKEKDKPAEANAARKSAAKSASAPAPAAAGKKGNGAAPIDPLQWWGALTQQFQEIAANAMKDVAQKTAAPAAPQAAAPKAGAAAKKTAARKSAPRKTRTTT